MVLTGAHSAAISESKSQKLGSTQLLQPTEDLLLESKEVVCGVCQSLHQAGGNRLWERHLSLQEVTCYLAAAEHLLRRALLVSILGGLPP